MCNIYSNSKVDTIINESEIDVLKLIYNTFISNIHCEKKAKDTIFSAKVLIH